MVFNIHFQAFVERRINSGKRRLNRHKVGLTLSVHFPAHSDPLTKQWEESNFARSLLPNSSFFFLSLPPRFFCLLCLSQCLSANMSWPSNNESMRSRNTLNKIELSMISLSCTSGFSVGETGSKTGQILRLARGFFPPISFSSPYFSAHSLSFLCRSLCCSLASKRQWEYMAIMFNVVLSWARRVSKSWNWKVSHSLRRPR